MPRHGHHRPYEGQQPDLKAQFPDLGGVIIAPTRGSNMIRPFRIASIVAVIIAPTRGSNMSDFAREEAAYRVIIAPTRGSNPDSCWQPPAAGGSHHRPYEGQQRR